MLAFIIVLSAWAYMQIGFLFGKLSHQTWFAEKPNPLLVFLLFPVSAYRGKVGYRDQAAIQSIFEVDYHNEGYFLYRTFMFFFWPVKFIWNIVAIAIAGPEYAYQAAKALRAERRAQEKSA